MATTPNGPKPMTISEMGRRGGLAAAARLTPAQRTRRARRAARARYRQARKAA